MMETGFIHFRFFPFLLSCSYLWLSMRQADGVRRSSAAERRRSDSRKLPQKGERIEGSSSKKREQSVRAASVSPRDSRWFRDDCVREKETEPNWIGSNAVCTHSKWTLHVSIYQDLGCSRRHSVEMHIMEDELVFVVPHSRFFVECKFFWDDGTEEKAKG